MNLSAAPVFFAGMVLSLSLIMAIGPQNAHVMRMGLLHQHLSALARDGRISGADDVGDGAVAAGRPALSGSSAD